MWVIRLKRANTNEDDDLRILSAKTATHEINQHFTNLPDVTHERSLWRQVSPFEFREPVVSDIFTRSIQLGVMKRQIGGA